MDEFNFFQFLNENNEILQAEDQHARDFATFCLHFGEYFADFVPSQAQNPRDPESTKSTTNEENQKPLQELGVERFPIISSDEIHELKSVTSNKNTSRFTKQYMNVFRSWCQYRHLEYVSIETMAPEELDKVLSKFYAEVRKKDGDDYEPESLKIIQSAIERYLKEKNYPLNIVQSREFHSSREILNAKAISLRQQGKGKRPTKLSQSHLKKSQPCGKKLCDSRKIHYFIRKLRT
ncbi:Uncharacterized protein KIAA1958-like [Stylophora pistillata]|uniref:Uncharacterized protein KIAA1958-like n=1 Tax=Stylophora pistillata TaxID=50429 RepID=A0A2B4RA26_STYPI|nr:Uncharacterized protein KIAA1958-like [Stylophora pistillata]